MRNEELITVACVKWGTKYSADYVNRLFAGVQRAMAVPFKFVCLTDDSSGVKCDTLPLDPGMVGWWNKIQLFKPGQFTGRVLFLDLDVVIVNRLDALLVDGIIRDWHLQCYNSSVMCWVAGQRDDIYTRFNSDVCNRLHGDQDWITELGGWPLYPDDMCVSYRSHAREWPPASASVVCFHGEPKPHQVVAGWVPKFWTESAEALRGLRFTQTLNTPPATMLEQARENLARPDVEMFREVPAHAGTALLVGGGPSLRDTLPELQRHKARGGVLFTMNGTHDWLLERGVVPDFHVMLDARESNVKFVSNPDARVTYLMAAQCHPALYDALKGHKIIVWTGWLPGMNELARDTNRPVLVVGGGNTVGLKAMCLASLWGFRIQRLFGFDSSYRGDDNHAYRQTMNDAEARLDIVVCGKKFHCARWMARQAEDFQDQYLHLTRKGHRIIVHGDGLIPFIYSTLKKQLELNGELAQ